MKHKIHSRRGASMLLGLLFLFFAMSIGAIVLTAATANAGRIARVRTAEQSYLAVQSAAVLLRDDLQTLRFACAYTETYPYSTDENGESTIQGPSYALTAASVSNTTFTTLLQSDFESLYRYQTGYFGVSSYTPTMHTATIRLDDTFPAVTATLSLADDYTLTAMLQSADGGAYPMVLRFTPQIRQSQSTESSDEADVTTYTTTVTLLPGIITKGGAT